MDIIESLKKEVAPSSDYIFDELNIYNKKIYILYNEVLCDSKSINDIIIYRLNKITQNNSFNLDKILFSLNTISINDNEILNYLNNGFLVIISDKNYACEFRGNLDRGVNKIESELSLSGSKDSFSEVYNTNLGLVRRRIKSEKLKVINMNIGRYTQTKIGISYVEGIVKMDLVNHIIKRLNKIDIDGIMDSSYLKATLENDFNLFPTIIMSERPDKCSMALLEGKVVIIVDNSPYALILPSFFMDFFHTTDDYFQKNFNTTFIRIIRLFAFFISIFTPAFYIAITTRNYSVVPLKLLLMLKAGRTLVPFAAYIEAIFMIICFEILKESDLRMSSTSGSAISILGGLILGDAAVAAGIVSPIMIIVIAISSIAGLIFTSFELGNALRTYKIFLLLLASLFGLYGLFFGTVVLFINILTTEIYGYNYVSLDKNEIKDSIIKIDEKVKYRSSKLSNNSVRGRLK